MDLQEIAEVNDEFYKNHYFDPYERFSFEVRSKTLIFKKILKRMKIQLKHKRILDYGFGSGNLLEYMTNLEDQAKYFGCEISESAILTSNLEKVDFKKLWVSDSKLPYQDNFFDIIISSHAIEHVKDEASLLKELQRCLKEDGILVIGVPSDYTKNHPLHYRIYNRKDIERICSYNFKTLYSKIFGSLIFHFLYKFHSFILSLIVSKNDSRKQNFKEIKNYSLSRKIYHLLDVNMLLFLYYLDSFLKLEKGIELWMVFQKKSSRLK